MSDPSDPELERQVLRGQFFVHTGLSQHTTRIMEIEAMLYGLIDLLLAKGAVPPAELQEAAREIRQEQAAQANPGMPLVAMRANDTVSAPPSLVNCAERLPICKAACCRLDFALNQVEIESGKVKWDLGRPYFIRKGSDGYCCHHQRDTGGCGIYADRPSVCRQYSCASDTRIWKDFDKMELADALLHPQTQLMDPTS